MGTLDKFPGSAVLRLIEDRLRKMYSTAKRLQDRYADRNPTKGRMSKKEPFTPEFAVEGRPPQWRATLLC